MPSGLNLHAEYWKVWFRLVMLTVMAGISSVASAQVQIQVEVKGEAGNVIFGVLPSDAKESLQNVTVNDSPEARKDIETARGMERQKEWTKAAGWYQEVLTKYRTRVVAWKTDSRNVINSYRGIVYQVQESLAKWPAEGINAYRSQYESPAAALIEAAVRDDSGTLQTVLDTYFITEAAKVAGLRLIDLHMESGEFDAAARIGELLLDWYPADHLIVERPRLLYRTALAHHLCGDEKMALSRADELKQKFPDAAGVIFGKDAVLTASLDGLLKVAPTLAQNLSPDSWMTYSGSPDRAHVSTAQGRMGAKIRSIELPPRPIAKGQQAAEAKMMAQQEESEGRTIGIMPVVDGSSLFFQDGSHLWAVGLDSGFPLPGWVQTYGNKGIYSLKSASSLRNQQYTLTLTDSAVLGVMGQSNRLQMMYAQRGMEFPAGADAGTRLVCLERGNGKERWKISLAALTGESLKDDERERLRALDLSGSPIVVGDNVYVIGRGGKDNQFENCYVLCFDVNTGGYRWSCLVASANTGANMSGDPSQVSGTLSHLAYASGRLYFLTNLGALASIDASSGSIVWLSLYTRDSNLNNDVPIFQGFRRGRAMPVMTLPNLRPWEFNPVFVQDGKLFLLPTDGKFILIYDATSGQELKRINIEEFDGARTILAVLGEKIILCSRRQVMGLNWANFDPAKSANENLQAGGWKTMASPGSDVQETIYGRGFVTADSVFISTYVSLLRMSLKRGGAVEETYPKDAKTGRHWDEKEGPGNVLVTGEHVILAGKTSVDIFTDMALARAKLDREVAALPDEADPRLNYSEVMFAAGQTPVSLEKLREAAGRLGGLDSLRPGASRQRLFNDALTFAQKLAKEQQGDAIEAAIQFFDIAAKAADSPSEQVSNRLNRAKFLRANVETGSYAKAVQLYQEILGHPEYRKEIVAESESSTESRGNVQAAVEAESQIAELIRQHPEAYDAVAKQALTAMESARIDQNAAKLLEVAQTFPNSPTAAKSMLAAADLYEQAGNPRLAAHVLRQVYRKYGDKSDKDRIIEAMARNYLRLPGGLEIAIALLQREKKFGDVKLSQPFSLPDGSKMENVNFRQAVAQLIKSRPEEKAISLPDIHVPFYRRLTAEERLAGKTSKPFVETKDRKLAAMIADITGLTQPPIEQRNAMRSDRLVATMGIRLAIFAAGQDKPLGTCDAFTDEPNAAIWSRPGGGKSKVTVWSHNELAALDGDTAAALWVSPLKNIPAMDVMPITGISGAQLAADSAPVDPNAVNNGQQQIFINGRGQRVFINGRGQRGGNVIFRGGGIVQIQNAVVEPQAVENVGQEQIAQVWPLDDRLIASTTMGRVFCLDANTGKLIWQTRLSSKAIERLVASEDFTALKMTDEGTTRLLVLDNFNGEIHKLICVASDPNLVPINMAMSPDGMLVWTLVDRLCGKDLYEPDSAINSADARKPTFQYPNTPRDANNPNGAIMNGTYFGCNQRGQLLIRGRQVIALEQNGRFVSVHSLDDGSLATHRSGGQEVKTLLTTGISQAFNGQPAEIPVTLRLVGSELYAYGSRSLLGYNLDDPEKSWRSDTGMSVSPNYRTALPTRDFLVMAGEPGTKKFVENPATRLFQLRLYKRTIPQETPGVEGGKLEQTHDLAEPAGIIAWQAVEGGLYYLSGDHNLHFLRGARE